MAIQWPVSLQQCLNADSFSFGKGDTKLRSDVDVGPAKVRSRYTKSIDPMNVSIYCSTAQYPDFEDFYTTILNNGTSQFEFLHPITKVTKLVRFVGSYEATPLGSGIQWNITMQWEILPQ